MLADHERPLAERGRRAAPAMAKRLHDLEMVPDLVFCSDARRTLQTWELVDDAWTAAGSRAAVEVRPELYLASPRTMLDVVASAPEHVESVMIVAHNPGTHDLARRLCRLDEGEEAEALRTKFPTAAVAIVASDATSWSAFGSGRSQLVRFIRPRDLTP